MNEKTNKIVECSLDDTGADVATTIAGHIAKKLPENLKGDNKINILQNEYGKRLSRGRLTVLSPLLTDFTCGCFVTLDFAKTIC